MRIELTISGLCVVALRRASGSDSQPVHPIQVDIIMPWVPRHRCRLSYDPVDLIPGDLNTIHADLGLDSAARHTAMWDIVGQALTLTATGSHVPDEFTVQWSRDTTEPSTPNEATALNWIPTLADLGFTDEFEIGPPGTLPAGAASRVTLPFGRLTTHNIIKDLAGRRIIWRFPAAADRDRVLADDIIHKVESVQNLAFVDAFGRPLLTQSSDEDDRVIRMCINNDDTSVDDDYRSSDRVLKHLRDFANLGFDPEDFRLPEKADDQRTGHPICMGVVYAWGREQREGFHAKRC
jgi:hypothetical protein